jgi:putative ABC transport system substrate-binding protein
MAREAISYPSWRLVKRIGRREALALLGGAATAWPLAVRAQQPAMPVIGFLNGASADLYAQFVRAFRQGLGDSGYIEGQNVAIEYRWADGQYDRLPALVADLVRRQVVVIAATSSPAALAAKAANATIPIVFTTAGDPVRLGLVASLNRPGGNTTGATQLNMEVAPKRLELLNELIPTATDIAFLVNPTNPIVAGNETRVLEAAARVLGMQLQVFKATTEREMDETFARMAQMRTKGLVIGSGDAFFNSQSRRLGALSSRHALPTIYQGRAFVAAGGLVSYGGSVADSYRLAGVYTGRILRGEKPADLPVQQSTKVEMIINLKTAKALGLTVSLPLLGRADEVIE